MEFLASQHINLSQHMTEEDAEMKMIQRALAGTAERENERAPGKIGLRRAASE